MTLEQFKDQFSGAPEDTEGMARRVLDNLTPSTSEEARLLCVAARSVVQGSEMLRTRFQILGIELG